VAYQLHQTQANLLVNRLGGYAPLAEHETALLHHIEGRAKNIYHADSRLLGEGGQIRAAHIIVSGWACSVHQLADGRRQIIGLLIPGDAVGLCPRPRPLAPSAVVAITPLRTVDASDLAGVWRNPQRYPNLSAALDIMAGEDEHYLQGHVIRLGRQTAYERVAHLFCELEYRLSARGLSADRSFTLPMTQEMIVDAAGLSVVHVNRTLQQMRREGRIELSKGRLSLLDLSSLREAGEFRPPKVSAPPDSSHPASH
jgi:CRP-like cAMP-binding protein